MEGQPHFGCYFILRWSGFTYVGGTVFVLRYDRLVEFNYSSLGGNFAIHFIQVDKKSNDGPKLTKLTTMGLICGFGGLMLLVAPSIGSGEMNPIGAAALIISSVSWAAGSIYSAKSKLPVSMLASSGMIMLTGGLMLAGVSFLFGEYKSLDLFQISSQSLMAQVYLIVIITIIGFTDFYYLLRVTSASLANTFAYVSPVIAVLLGWAILNEHLTITTIVAMIIILFGVALMVTKKKKIVQSKVEKKEI